MKRKGKIIVAALIGASFLAGTLSTKGKTVEEHTFNHDTSVTCDSSSETNILKDDKENVTIYVYAVPEGDSSKVSEIINEKGISVDTDSDDASNVTSEDDKGVATCAAELGRAMLRTGVSAGKRVYNWVQEH